MTDLIKRLEKEALSEMLHYHKKTGRQKVKDLVKRATGRYVSPLDLIFWPTGLLANALTRYYELWEDKEDVLNSLIIYYDRWIDKRMPILCIDDVLSGVGLIDLYKITGIEKYKIAADKMARYLYGLEEKEKDMVGNIPYRAAQKNHFIFVDGIGMMCPFLSKYGAEFNDSHALELAVLQIQNMIKYGMDDKKYLPYHGFVYESKTKYGIIGWGRAMGWLMLGLADTMKFLPHDHREYRSLSETFYKLIDSALVYQKEDGAFAWQLEAVEGPDDSSATAMIALAVLTGLENGFISEDRMDKSLKLVEMAAVYLSTCEKNGKIFSCSGECLGFSQYPQVYHAYPWSLGPGLAVILGVDKYNK